MDNKIELIREDGTIEKCELIFTHHSEEFNKDYIVALPEGSDSFIAMQYVQDDEEGGRLVQIETEEEWNLIEKLLEQFLDEEDACGCDEGCECGEDDCDCEEECCSNEDGDCCTK